MKHQKRIMLGWANATSDKDKNFGDELSPYIIKKLSGAYIDYVPIITSRSRLILMIIKRITLMPWKERELFVFFKLLVGSSYFLSLGSILQFYRFNKAIVWGSGLISQHSKVGKNIYFSVRGPLTRAALLKKGYEVPEVYGDPAILLPLFFSNLISKKNIFGYVPHKIHWQNFKDKFNDEKNIIINLSTGDVEKVVNEIRSCTYIISSSLHGLIVAHAFGIPALWFKLGENELLGDNMKFDDYFLSVGIDPYMPFDFNSILIEEDLNITFFKNNNLSLPKNDLRVMSKKLLKNAPFDMKDKYLNTIL